MAQRSELDAVEGELSSLLVRDPVYRQPIDSVVSGNNPSTIAVLALVYFVCKRLSR